MRAAYRVADVRAAEAGLAATVPGGTLMARAAAGLARRCGTLLGESGGRYGARVLLLVGVGDNGGDALLAGARLARQGVAVGALPLDPARTHAAGLAALRAAGGRVVDAVPDRVDLVVDGIVGLGSAGGLRPAAAAAAAAARAARPRAGTRPVVVAADLPSGVAPDTGDVPGAAVPADVTVAFGCLKPGLVVGAGARCAGRVEVVDIGLGPWLRAGPALRVATEADVARWWPRPGRVTDKYRRGVVGLATGSAGYPGAAVLSAAGASAGPAGMLRYAGPARAAVLAAHPQVVATGAVAEAGRVQAWVCGCGLGTDAAAAATLRAVLAAPVPAVLDADALTLLVDGGMADLLRDRAAGVVLTPHDGEFRRLAGADPGADRVDAAQRLAAWTRCVVLLKGDRTVVADPAGETWVSPTGTAALASAGTGDVLAGLLGALLAARVPPLRAAVAAAYLHGRAGRAAAAAGAVTAPDVAAALRRVVPRTGEPDPVRD
ncbi:NAD(P)H-hydrate dehydratase [Pilimelia terevasa]|uniref:NAD(P)H-hydrate dehydratase n=1 Tax=Pilimelia terevasa TaxID=53372 RepID=UPI0016694470|nr:NAD(P)H-hydrate dehydratase [Pilimelia terevasa]